jgi:hypothetical protein
VRTETAVDGTVMGYFKSTGIRSAYAHQVEAAGFKLNTEPAPVQAGAR